MTRSKKKQTATHHFHLCTSLIRTGKQTSKKLPNSARRKLRQVSNVVSATHKRTLVPCISFSKIIILYDLDAYLSQKLTSVQFT